MRTNSAASCRTSAVVAACLAVLLALQFACAAQDPETLRAADLTNGWAPLYPVEQTMSGVAATDHFYGLSVHVAVPQCIPSHDRFWLRGPLATNTSQYVLNDAACAFFFSRHANGTYFKSVARYLHFHPSKPSVPRGQVTFGWVLWLTSNEFSLVDVESRHVWARIDPLVLGPKTWRDAETTCIGLHGGVHSSPGHLPSVITDHEHHLMLHFRDIDSAGTLDKAAVYFARDNNLASAKFRWRTGETVGIQAWLPSRPDNAGGNELYAGLRFADRGWNDYDTSATFDAVVCEFDAYASNFHGQVSFVVEPSAYLAGQHAKTLQPPIPLNRLPTNAVELAVTVFGATVMTASADCSPTDKWWMSRSHDHIAHLNSGDLLSSCRMYLGGAARVSNYNDVMVGLWWSTNHTERHRLRQGYVYWTSQRTRYAVTDMSNLVIAAVAGKTYHTPAASFLLRAGTDACVNEGMSLAEPDSEVAVVEIERTLVTAWSDWMSDTATWLMGHRWNSGSSAYEKPTATIKSIDYFGWTCAKPLGAKQCTVTNAFGRWDAADCAADEVTGALCSRRDHPFSNHIDDASRFASVVHPQTTRRESVSDTILTGSDLVRLPDFYTTYGFMIQISVAQCTGGDTISTSVPAPFASLIRTNTYTAAACARNVRYVAGGAFANVSKSIIVLSRLSYTDVSRIQFHVGWHILTDERVANQAATLVMDVESRLLYAWLPQQTAAWSWDEACRACTALLGAPFELVTISSTSVEKLMAVSRDPFLPSPIRARRQNDQPNAEFLWLVNGNGVVRSRDQPLYVNRMPANGPGASTDMCLASTRGGTTSTAEWEAVRCDPPANSPPNFVAAFCRRSSEHYFSGTVSLAGDATKHQRPFFGRPFPTPGMLPGSLSQEDIFGATVSVSKHPSADTAGCVSTSTWYFPTASHDHIGVLRHEPCAIFFTGLATVSEYSTLLHGLEFRTTTPSPSTAWFGYVYWSTRHLRELLLSPQTSRVFAIIRTNARWTASAAYPYWSAWQYCQRFAMDTYEVHSLVENEDVLALRTDITNRSDVLIGVTAVAGTYRWFSNTAMTYTNFLNRHDSLTVVPGHECATLTAWGSWRNSRCESLVPGGIACRATGLTYLHSGRRQAPLTGGTALPLPVLESRRTLRYSSTFIYSIFEASDVQWLPSSQTVFGATAQVSPRQCQSPTDYFAFRSTTYSNQFRMASFVDACAEFLRHRTADAFALSHLQAYIPHLVMYTGDRTRRQLTFTLTIWLDPRVQWVMSDVDTKHAYVLLTSRFVSSWQRTADRCSADLGSSWSMILPNTAPEARFLSSTVPTPILLLRNTSAAFVWGRDTPLVYSALVDNSDFSKTCAVASNSRAWANEACDHVSPSGVSVVCEADSWNATAFVWLALPENAEATSYRQLLPLNFPPDTTPTPTTVHGVTVQVARRECMINDRYVFDYGFNTLQLNYADACTLMLSGKATIAQYNYALKGVFHRSSEHRKWISFRSMYWMKPLLDRVLYSFAHDDDRVFAVVRAETTFVPSPGYPFYGANYLCGAFGGVVAAVTSAAANADVQAAAKATTNFLGAQRSSTGVFEWSSDPTPISYTPYIYGPLGSEPTPSLDCLTLTPSGLWRAADCTSPTRDGVVCQFSAWSKVAKTNVSFIPERSPPPTTNRTRERVITFDSAGKSLIFDDADLATFNDGTQCYGASVQLNIQQVLAGDAFEFNTALDTNILGFQPVVPPQATLCLYTTASRLTEHFRAVLRTVKFAPVQRSRTQLQFSYILWLHPKPSVSSTFPSMLFDAESRHAYSFFQLPSSQRWAETLSTCRNLGPQWDLPTVNTPSENSLLRTFQLTSAAPSFPLRGSRTEAGAMMWDNGDSVTFADWNVDTDGMRNASVECLAMLGRGQPPEMRGHAWDAVECEEPIFPSVVCETSEWTTYGVVSYLGAKNFNPSGVVLRDLVPSADLSAAGFGRVVYGLTVQSHRTDCRSTDGFLSTASDAFVFVAYNDPCSIMFGGTATVGDYKRFVDGVLWTTVYSNRTSIRFGAVLWATKYVTRLAVDFARQSAFFLNVAESQFVPSESFMPNASGLCTQNGMRLAQLVSPETADAFESLERTQETTIGLQRRIVGMVDDWHHVPSNSLATHTRWLRDEPLSGNECVQVATWDVWISVGCDLGVPSTGCEIVSWPVPLIFRTLPLPSESAERRRDRIRRFDYAPELASTPTVLRPFVNISATDLKWLDPTAVLYGVTVQLAAEQCVFGDAFAIDRTTLPDTSFVLSTVPNTCIARLVRQASQPPNAWASSVFYPALDAVEFRPVTRGRIRRQLAFAYVLWTNELALNLAMDVSTGAVITTSQPEPSARLLTRTWDQAWAFCRRLGPTWSVPAVSSITGLKLLHSQLTNTGAAIAVAMRRTPSQTFVWTDMRPQSVLPWATAAPGDTSTGNCTLSSSAGLGQLPTFETTACSDARFVEVLCEAGQWQGSGVVTYLAATPGNATARFFPLVPSAAIPTSAGEVYGATVQVRVFDCRASDVAYATANYDGIVVATATPCLQQLAGPAPIDEYRRIIGATGIAALATERVSVVAAAVLWPTSAHRFLMMASDLPDSRYLLVPVFVQHGDGVARRAFADVCAETSGLHTAELLTKERREAALTALSAASQWQDFGPAAVGLSRRTPLPDAVFVGDGSRAVPTGDGALWFAGQPAAVAGHDCAAMSASGLLRSRACTGVAAHTTASICAWSSATYNDATFHGAKVSTTRTEQPSGLASASAVDPTWEHAAAAVNVSASPRVVAVSRSARDALVLTPFEADPRLDPSSGAFGTGLDTVHGVTLHLSQQACDRLPLNVSGAGSVESFFRWDDPPTALLRPAQAEIVRSTFTACWVAIRATTRIANLARIVRTATATLDFAAHPLDEWFAGGLPSALTFGYIVWPTALASLPASFDVETSAAVLWFRGRPLASPTPFAITATRSAYHSACAGLIGGGAARLVEATSLPADRLLRGGVPQETTGNVVLGLHRADSSGAFRNPSGRPVSVLRFASAAEPTAAGRLVGVQRGGMPSVIDASRVAPLSDDQWVVMDDTATVPMNDGAPVGCEVDPRHLSDTIGTTTVRLFAIESVSNASSAGVADGQEDFSGVISIHAPPARAGYELVVGPFDAVLPGDSNALVFGATMRVATVDVDDDHWLLPSHHLPIAVVRGHLLGDATCAVRGRATVTQYNTLMRNVVAAFARAAWNRYSWTGEMASPPRYGFVYWTLPWAHEEAIYFGPGGAPVRHYVTVPVQATLDAAAQGRGLPAASQLCGSLGLWEATVDDIAVAASEAPGLGAAGDLLRRTALVSPRIGVRDDAGVLRFSASGAPVPQWPGESTWLAEEPRATAMVTLEPTGRWRGIAGTSRHSVVCEPPSSHPYRRDINIPNLQLPPGAGTGPSLAAAMLLAERATHTFVASTRVDLWPFSNRTDVSSKHDVLAPVLATTHPVYGMTVQLDGRECRGDTGVDSLTIVSDPPVLITRPVYNGTTVVRNDTVLHPGLAAANASARYIARACVLTTKFETPQPAIDAALILERVRFTSSDLSRGHLRFTFTLWQTAQQSDVLADAAAGVAVARVDAPGVSFTRDGAATACHGQGTRWALAQMPSLVMQDAVLAANGGARVFVAAHRTASGLRSFDDGSDVVAARWRTGHPTTKSCVAIEPQAATGVAEWVTLDCTALSTSLWCEVPLRHLRFTGSIIWQTAPRDPLVAGTASTPVALSVTGTPTSLSSLSPAPSSSTVPCYGVRGLISTSTCRDLDRWQLEPPDGRFLISERTPCTVEIVGPHAVKEYVALLPSVKHVRAIASAARSEVRVNTIFYMTPNLHRVGATQSTGYTAIRALSLSNRPFSAYDDFETCAVLERTGVSGTWKPAVLDSTGLASSYSQYVSTAAHRTALGATYNRTFWEWSRGWLDRWNPPQFEALPMNFMNSDPSTAAALGPSTSYGLAATAFGQWVRVRTNDIVDAVACTTGEPYRFSTSEATVPVPTPAPSAASTAQTRRLAIPLTPFKPIRAQELPSSLDNATLVTSAVVHVPIQQCVAGIDRVVVAPDCPLDLEDSGITAKANDGDCSLHFSGPQNAGIYKQLLAECALYDTGAQFKVQIAFAWAMSNQPRLWHRMSYDMVSRKLYALLPLNDDARSWDGAAWSCRDLGPGWRLPAIANAAENAIVAGLAQAARADRDLAGAVDMGTFTSVPLAMARNPGGTAVWTHKGTSVAFQNFDSGTTPTAGWDCFVMQVATGTWVDTPCTTVPFPITVCETQGYDLAGLLTYASSPADLTPAQDLPVFGSGDLNEDPAAANRVIYGAVVQISARDSKPSDRLLAAEASDKILLVRVGAYVLQLVGQATIKEYNEVLGAVKLQTYNTERSVVRAGFLYYTSAAVTNAFIDLSRVPIASPKIWVPFFLPLTDVANPFTQMRAVDFCAGLGLGMEVTTSAEQAAEQVVATVYPTTLLGTRPTANGSFYNYDPNVARVHGETCAACDPCVVLTMYGKWRPASCSEPQAAIMCTGTASAGDFGFALLPTAVVAPYNENADRTLALPADFSSTGVLYPFASVQPWSNVPGASEIFGVTLQVPLAQCLDINTSIPLRTNLTAAHAVTELVPTAFRGSVWALSTSKPGAALWGDKTLTRVLSGCVTYVSGASSAGAYETITQAMLWATNTPETVKFTTFAASLWTDPRLSNVTYDWGGATLFASLQSPSPKSWYESYAECALLGPSWALPALVTPAQERIASVLVFNRTVGIGALRVSGAAFTWTNGQIFAMQRWSTSFPTATTGTECAVALPPSTLGSSHDPGVRTWLDADCDDKTQLRDPVCASSRTDTTFQVAYAAAAVPADVAAVSFYLARVFKESQLPKKGKGSTPAYGVTVQRTMDICEPGDVFAWGAVTGRHALTYSRDGCVAWVVGHANTTVVTNILRHVAFWSTNALTRAAQSKFGYVVWTKPQPHGISIDVESARHFVSVPFGTRFTPPASYPFGGAVDTCTALGGALVEPPTALEVTVALSAAPFTRRLGNPLVGITRRSIGGLLQFAYVSEDVPAYTKWSGRDPGLNAGDCVVANPDGTYAAVKCDTAAAALLCILDGPYPIIWPPQSSTRTLPPTATGSESANTGTFEASASFTSSESHEPSPSDTVSISLSLRESESNEISPSSSRSVGSDSVTQSVSPDMTDSTAVTVTDSFSGSGGLTRSLSKSRRTGTISAASRTASWSETDSSTLTFSTSTTRTLPLTITPSVSASVSESTTVTPPPTRTSTVSTTLTISRTVTPPPTRTATFTVTPPPTFSRTTTETETKSITMTPPLTGTRTLTLSESDSSTLTPELSLSGSFTQSESDSRSTSTTLTETDSSTTSLEVTVSDSEPISLTETRSVTDTLGESETVTVSDATGSGSTSRSPTMAITLTAEPTPSDTADSTATETGSVSVSPSVTESATLSRTVSATVTPPPTPTHSGTFSVSDTFTESSSGSLWPTGLLEHEATNITAEGIQDGDDMWMEFTLTWDSWLCRNLSIATVVIRSKQLGNAFGIGARSGNIFTQRSVVFCNRTVLRLQLQRDRAYDSYVAEFFTVTFNGATLRQVTPEPREIEFEIQPAGVPNDVAAAVVAAQVSSQASLLGGPAASSNQALAIMGLSPCARPAMRIATEKAKNSMVPVPLEDTYQGWFFGNFVLLAFVSVVHFPVVVVIREVLSVSWYDAREFGLFPSVSITVTQILHAGIAYASINLVVWGTSAADYAIGVAGMVYCWAMPAAMWFWSQRLLETRYLDFAFRKAMTNPVARFFIPDGFFLPEQYAGALGQLREATKSHMIVKYLQINGFTLIGAIRAESVPECIALYSCLAVWFTAFAVYAAVIQPNKAPVFNLGAFLLDIEMALIAVGCAIWAADREFGVLIVTKLLLVQNVTGMAVSVIILAINAVEKLFWRGREIKERASAAVVNVLGGAKTRAETDASDDEQLEVADEEGEASADHGDDEDAEEGGSARRDNDGGDRDDPPRGLGRTADVDDPFRLDFDDDDAAGSGGELQRGADGNTIRRNVAGGATRIDATGAYTRRVRLQDEEEDRAVMDMLEHLGRSRAPPPGTAGETTASGRQYSREERFLLSMPDPTGMLHPWDVDADEVARDFRERAEQQRKDEAERRHRSIYGQTTSDWLGLADDGFFKEDNATSGMWANDAMELLGVQTPAVPLQQGGDETIAGARGGENSMLTEAEREELQRLAAWEPATVQEAFEKFDRMERLRNPWSVDEPGAVDLGSRGRSSGTKNVSSVDSATGGGSGARSGNRNHNGTGSPSPGRMGTVVEASTSLRTFLESTRHVDALDDAALADITDEEVLGPVLSNPRNARQRFEAALRLEQFREHVRSQRRLARGREAIDRVLSRPTQVERRSTSPRPGVADSDSTPAGSHRDAELWDIL